MTSTVMRLGKDQQISQTWPYPVCIDLKIVQYCNTQGSQPQTMKRLNILF